MVTPSDCSSTMVDMMRCIISGESPIEGSSSISSFGRLIIARPIASICCSPPENVPAGWERLSRKISKRLKTRSRSCATPPLSLRAKAPSIRFSSTVNRGKIRRPSGECAKPRVSTSCAGVLSIRSPSNQISPDSGLIRPEMVRSVVVLPAPLVPRSVTTWPWSTLKLIPLTAMTRPYATFRSLTSSIVVTLLLERLELGGVLRSCADVSLDDPWVGLDLGWRAFDQGSALNQTQHAVAEVEDEPHVVLDDNNRKTKIANLEDQVLGLPSLLGIHARCRLVQQQQLGIGTESASNFESPLVAVGQIPRQVIGRVTEPDEVEQLLGTYCGRLLIAAELRPAEDRRKWSCGGPAIAANHHVLERGHIAKQPDVLEGPRHPRYHNLAGLRWQHCAIEYNSPLRGHVEAGQTVEKCRLAGPVRADQTHDLASVDLESHCDH